jgi:hypothetical protein
LQKNQDHSDRNTFPTRTGAYGAPQGGENRCSWGLSAARILADMSISNGMSKTTAAFFMQTVIAFAVSFASSLGGILFLPLDPWQRLFLGISLLFLVSSAFSLAKVVRDQQESTTVRVRLDEARVEKMLAEHNPFSGVS